MSKQIAGNSAGHLAARILNRRATTRPNRHCPAALRIVSFIFIDQP
jgi:hypothetical protein